jgi:hypothetical protein
MRVIRSLNEANPGLSRNSSSAPRHIYHQRWHVWQLRKRHFKNANTGCASLQPDNECSGKSYGMEVRSVRFTESHSRAKRRFCHWARSLGCWAGKGRTIEKFCGRAGRTRNLKRRCDAGKISQLHRGGDRVRRTEDRQMSDRPSFETADGPVKFRGARIPRSIVRHPRSLPS